MQRQYYYCTHEGCERNHHARGLCALHYKRHRLGIDLDAVIRGEEPPEDRFWRQVIKTKKPPKFCWEWQGAKNDGYGVIRIEGVLIRCPQYSFFLKHGRYPKEGLIIRHTCDNPSCVNPKHLLEGTFQDNYNDMKERGRIVTPKGVDVVTSKLTEKDVKRIRRMYDRGVKIPQIHLDYKFIHIETLRVVAKRKAWKHVPEARDRSKKEVEECTEAVVVAN